MSNYKIITDSSCDLTQQLAGQLELSVVPLAVNFRGQEYRNFPDHRELDVGLFYEGLRTGERTSTTAANPTVWRSAAEPILQNGEDVLILAFSSGLSTTYQSAVIAATELREKYPERKILVLDTLSASVGHGLMVWHAARLRDEGKDIDTVYAWLEEHIPNVCHWVTVNDLMHLKRGGRVSAATAVVGTMLQIKPVLIVDNAGKLETVAKARGRKAAIHMLVEKLTETGIPGENDTVFLGHGDCPEEAEVMAQLLKEAGAKNVIVSHVGNVIGSPTGPDVLVIAFLGTAR